MPLELVTIPCLEDNYAFLLHNDVSGETLLVDVPDAAPIQKELDKRGWTLTDILLTHHHWDHIDGLPNLKHDARIIGAKADQHRLPPLHLEVSEGDHFTVCGSRAEVFDVSGHTVGHIAVYIPDGQVVFTADSLMALGCGRLFEGTAAQMWSSMKKMRDLPDETQVCSGHEYTLGNARFALSIDPDNAALVARAEDVMRAVDQGRPTVPSLLGLEKETNPFLRADDPTIAAQVGLENATADDVFAEIRRRKDNF